MKELERFGLSAKQAQVYLLLVARGSMRVQEIADTARVPRSSVYEHLKRLMQLGLTEETLDGSSKTYRAYPIGVLRHALDEEIARLQQRASDVDVLERSISFANLNNDSSLNMRTYRGQVGARQILWNSLKAKDDVYVYSEWGRQHFVGLKFYERFVSESHRRHISERVLINLTPQILADIKARNVPALPSARTNVSDIRVLDGKTARIAGDTLMYNGTYAQLYLRGANMHGFEIENADFVAAQRSIFETLWAMARPVADYLHH